MTVSCMYSIIPLLCVDKSLIIIPLQWYCGDWEGLLISLRQDGGSKWLNIMTGYQHFHISTDDFFIIVSQKPRALFLRLGQILVKYHRFFINYLYSETTPAMRRVKYCHSKVTDNMPVFSSFDTDHQCDRQTNERMGRSLLNNIVQSVLVIRSRNWVPGPSSKIH